MYQQKDFSLFQNNYFNVLELSNNLIYIQSKNTYHFWQIQPTGKKFILHHKHFSRNWHVHKNCKSLQAAIQEIKNHDSYVISRANERFFDVKDNPAEKYFYF